MIQVGKISFLELCKKRCECVRNDVDYKLQNLFSKVTFNIAQKSIKNVIVKLLYICTCMSNSILILVFMTGKLGEMVAGIISYIPWNVLNFAAGIAPITKWNNEDTKQMENYPRDDMFARMIASMYVQFKF